MPKESGMGDNLYVAGWDLSGDIGAVNVIATRVAPLEVPGIDKSAMERIPGIRDGEISFNAWWDTTTDQEHTALSSLPTADRTVLYFHGAAVGNPVAAMIGKQINYDWTRGQDGSLAGTIQVLGNGSAVDWGDQLTTGKQTFSGAANGTSIDYTTVSTAFGAVAYLQVFAFTGTNVTVTIADSADNSSFTPITGLAFTAATGRTEQRLATAITATIRRYVRAQLTGTFSNAVIAVSFTKFLSAQS
jgi:hypothetical protein